MTHNVSPDKDSSAANSPQIPSSRPRTDSDSDPKAPSDSRLDTTSPSPSPSLETPADDTSPTTNNQKENKKEKHNDTNITSTNADTNRNKAKSLKASEPAISHALENLDPGAPPQPPAAALSGSGVLAPVESTREGGRKGVELEPELKLRSRFELEPESELETAGEVEAEIDALGSDAVAEVDKNEISASGRAQSWAWAGTEVGQVMEHRASNIRGFERRTDREGEDRGGQDRHKLDGGVERDRGDEREGSVKESRAAGEEASGYTLRTLPVFGFETKDLDRVPVGKEGDGDDGGCCEEQP